MRSRYGTINPYTEEDAKEKLETLNKDEFLKKWEEDKTQLKKTISEVKKIVGEKDSHFVDLMQFIVYYRTQRTDIVNKAIYYFHPALEKLAKEKGVTYQELIHATCDEIRENKIPERSVLQDRIKDCAIVCEDGKIYCVSGKESQKIREFLKEDVTGLKEFSGTIACRGKVTGIAKLIHMPSDVNKINDGDILVTSMTTPNMLSALKIAGAFVTDEGGITCHAAILSRELNKPCIIGTRIATQVLNDGDLVEVDANIGVIKILNNK
jgi:phosphoenolpyruvate synthase/pyruvate phosphate dikinase